MGVIEEEIPTAQVVELDDETRTFNHEAGLPSLSSPQVGLSVPPSQQANGLTGATSSGAVLRKEDSDEELGENGQKKKQKRKYCFSFLKLIDVGSVHKGTRWVIPKKIVVASLLGGTDLDFSNGIFTGDVHVTVAPSIAGSCHITVPPGVKVVSNGVALLGGFHSPKWGSGDIDTPTVYLKGLTILGSVKASVNKTAPPIRIESNTNNLGASATATRIMTPPDTLTSL